MVFPVFQFVPISSCLVTGHHWGESGSVFFTSHPQVFILTGLFPLSFLFCGLKNPSSLSLSCVTYAPRPKPSPWLFAGFTLVYTGLPCTRESFTAKLPSTWLTLSVLVPGVPVYSKRVFLTVPTILNWSTQWQCRKPLVIFSFADRVEEWVLGFWSCFCFSILLK